MLLFFLMCTRGFGGEVGQVRKRGREKEREREREGGKEEKRSFVHELWYSLYMCADQIFYCYSVFFNYHIISVIRSCYFDTLLIVFSFLLSLLVIISFEWNLMCVGNVCWNKALGVWDQEWLVLNVVARETSFLEIWSIHNQCVKIYTLGTNTPNCFA